MRSETGPNLGEAMRVGVRQHCRAYLCDICVIRGRVLRVPQQTSSSDHWRSGPAGRLLNSQLFQEPHM